MEQTLYQKIVASHTVFRVDEQHVVMYADLHIMNEYTSPQAFAGLAEKHLRVRCPEKQMGIVDHVIPTHPVAVDKRSLMYLDGAKIDFHDELNKTGFSITNPSAKSTCGCGSSWSM